MQIKSVENQQKFVGIPAKLCWTHEICHSGAHCPMLLPGMDPPHLPMESMAKQFVPSHLALQHNHWSNLKDLESHISSFPKDLGSLEHPATTHVDAMERGMVGGHVTN